MTETTTEQPTPALDQLAEALAAFQAEMPTVPKAHTARIKDGFSYTYAGLADVSEAAMPLLAKHGLSFTTLPGQGVLTGMLLHRSGQHLTASLPIGNGTPQQVGSSLTYMRRYLLGCMTGLVTDDDDDGRQASSTSKPRAAKKAAAAPPREPVDDPWAKPETDSGGGGITTAQTRLMGALMRTAGLPDRDSALLYVKDVIGREVASRNDLTSQEASKVIDALQAETKDQETRP